jgi:hypothetical protein
MKHMKRISAVAGCAVMIAACTTGTTDPSGNGLTDTTFGETDVAGIVVVDQQAVNDLLVEFDTIRTEIGASASAELISAWNVLEIQMANLIVSADTGAVPQEVIDDTRDAIQDVTAAIQAEGDTVTESLNAAWNAFVNRFQTLTS